MNSKPQRIKIDRHWYYLYTINGKEGHYPINKLAKHEDCVVDRQVLAVRLAGFFKGSNTWTSIHHCMTRPLVYNTRTTNRTPADFDLLNKLWR